MRENYSFLKDELALLEIRKHKWLESEKAGREIGFATAAVDWVKKYGAQWKSHRAGQDNPQHLFQEKRQHRRFYSRIPIRLQINNNKIQAQTDSINLVGLSCTIPQYVPPENAATVTLSMPRAGSEIPRFVLKFQSRIKQVRQKTQNTTEAAYQLFIPFGEDVRDYLRTHPGFLAD
ncbi:MAG: hypothetical protein Q8Q08_03040 [Candidatus Omnitrophota bacterium]|nr:hypothetical protein [Candidatus Omnitrophota bacterium]MDZ4242465.1 hypothetical protein [Candidatus Omnitrophota bacterium]